MDDVLMGFFEGSPEHNVNSLEHACGLDSARPLLPGQVGEGMVVTVDGQAYDLTAGDYAEADLRPASFAGDDRAESFIDNSAEAITLADEHGLSIYSDFDGDGAVDHVTTVRFDGTWETWEAGAASSPAAGAPLGETSLEAESQEAASQEASQEAALQEAALQHGALPEPQSTSSGSIDDWGAYEWEEASRDKWG